MKQVIGRNVALAALVLGGMTASGSALAQPAQGYLGLGLGSANYDIDNRDWDDSSLSDVSIDEEDLAWKIYAGVRFKNVVGLEISYFDLNNTDVEAVSDGSGEIYESGNISGEARAEGAAASLWLAAPITEEVHAYVRGGLTSWTSRVSVRDSNGSEVERPSGTGSLVGAGVRYDFHERLGLRAEWERYRGIFDGTESVAAIGSTEVDVFSIGLTLRL